MHFYIPFVLVKIIFLLGGIGLIIWSFEKGSGTAGGGLIPVFSFEPVRLVLGLICIFVFVLLAFFA